jgi:hypothetical protein
MSGLIVAFLAERKNKNAGCINLLSLPLKWLCLKSLIISELFEANYISVPKINLTS